MNHVQMKHLLITAILAIFMQTSHAQSHDETQIRSLRDHSNDAIASKDITALSKHWVDDFVVVRGNGTQMSGKAAIIEVWKKMFTETPDVKFVRMPTEIKISSDKTFAWEKGTWEGFNTYSKGGEYSAMWRKVDGEWKLQAELFVALR
jgi:ketosteroid isomerase-like protein